ncbi:lactotransferrin [Meriones unguiculatus]|uniref:lactotransferrin n=1 Tax=Meriones unguiculatus TaxID=10047 RepID=UPI00293EAFC3|nr:lactotransferrin [Meriones unguiculatus]
MKLLIPALLFLEALGLCLAKTTVRWCAVSKPEAQKCSRWQKAIKKMGGQPLSCVKRSSTRHCIRDIMSNKADAMALDGGSLFDAGPPPYKLRPVAAEVYGTKIQPRTHYYAVAVVKNSSTFHLNQLRSRKSCHTGFGRSAGWNIPIGTLRPYLNWEGPPVPIEEAVSRFFSKSCVPGVNKDSFPNLCSLCAGSGENKCASSSEEPYSGYAGAFRCLRDNAGDVAFTRASTIFEELPNRADWHQYKLLCPDNTWKPVTEYKDCHLAQVPSHTVVARSMNGKEDAIWELLSQSQETYGKDKASEFQLFVSSEGQRDLLFKDSAIGFERVPPYVDVGLYLTFNYITSILNLRKKPEDVIATRNRVTWCAVGSEEKHKCDQWSRASGGRITCASFPSTEDCIISIMKGDADAMSLDGGYIYIAGKCGLVPVLAENQKSSKSNSSDCVERPVEGYFAVAAVRAEDDGFTWSTVRGEKSCHTSVDRTAGWNIPMGLLVNQTKSCKFDEFFTQSCAPGADPKSSLCALCIGDKNGKNKCAPNSKERYSGYTGAFRCLAENSGNVAFLKDSTVLQNTDGKNTEEWAKDLKQEEFELLCLDDTRKPVTEAKNCHLAIAPNHAVVSRTDKVQYLQRVMLDQQILFGRYGSKCPSEFCLFHSNTKNLLFNDNTECLSKLHDKTTSEKYLGQKYVTAIEHLKQCSSSPLLEACIFLTQ